MLQVKADGMPAILCDKCTDRLKVAYDFCRTANISEKQLRKFISKISFDFREVTKTLPKDDNDEDYVVMEEFDGMNPALLEEPEEIIPQSLPVQHQTPPPLPPPPPQPAAPEPSIVVEESIIQKRNLKIEVTEMEHEEIELMVEEPHQDSITIGKQEALGSEIEMEEFHEIIQDDQCDTNLYLDENTYEELQLYENEDGEIYDHQQVDEEGK